MPVRDNRDCLLMRKEGEEAVKLKRRLNRELGARSSIKRLPQPCPISTGIAPRPNATNDGESLN